MGMLEHARKFGERVAVQDPGGDEGREVALVPTIKAFWDAQAKAGVEQAQASQQQALRRLAVLGLTPGDLKQEVVLRAQVIDRGGAKTRGHR